MTDGLLAFYNERTERVMRVEGISNYYAFMYNRNTGKITSDSEADDGFADFYNSGKNSIPNPEYNARKAGIKSLAMFFNTPGENKDLLNIADGNDECTVIEEKSGNGETRYYVDGKLMFTSMPGEITTNIKFAPDSITGKPDGEGMEFNDVSRISISDISEEEEEHVSPKRKTGQTSEVVVYPDGSRWLVTTMYFCGKEIKIVKKLPPIDQKEDEEDSLLRQDNEDEEDKPGIADTKNVGINQSILDVIQSYMEEDDDGLLDESLLFPDDKEDKEQAKKQASKLSAQELLLLLGRD